MDIVERKESMKKRGIKRGRERRREKERKGKKKKTDLMKVKKKTKESFNKNHILL